MIKFYDDITLKSKIYPFNYKVKGKNRLLIIVITHNKYIFSTNNRIQKAWTWERYTFL